MARTKLLARSPFRPAFGDDPLDDFCVPIRLKHYGTFVDADTIGQLQGLLAHHPQAGSRPDQERSSSDDLLQQQHREVEPESAKPDAKALEQQRKLREWRATALHNKRFMAHYQAQAAAAQQRAEQLEREYADLRRDHDGLELGYGQLWRAYEDLVQEFEQLLLSFDHPGDDYRNLQQTYDDLRHTYQRLMQKAEESGREAARPRKELDLIVTELRQQFMEY